MNAVDEVTARLASQIPSRTVFARAVPDGALPARYLLVHGSVGFESSSTMCDAHDQREPTVWVTSVSRNDMPEVAAREAEWGAEKARDALRGFRPALGRTSWKVAPEVSQPARRDESIPSTTFYAVEQFTIRYQE